MKKLILVALVLASSTCFAKDVPDKMKPYMVDKETLECRAKVVQAVNDSNMKVMGEPFFKDELLKHVLFDLEGMRCEDTMKFVEKISAQQAFWVLWKNHLYNK